MTESTMGPTMGSVPPGSATLIAAHRPRWRGLRFACVTALLMLLSVAWPAAEPAADSEAAYDLGMRRWRAGEAENAARSFERAVDLDPALAKAWLQLGMARSRLGDWDSAIEAYLRLIELEPENPKAPNNLANVHFRRGDHAEAARWYARALELDPDYLLAAFHYGWMLRELNRPDEAERWFAHCSEIESSNDRERKTRLDCLYYFGAQRFRARDYAEAAPIMERVLKMFPSHPEARYYLGMSYRQLGRAEEAEEQFEMHHRILQSIRSSQPIEKQPEP